MFKECLANDVVPFIITDDVKVYYYRSLKEWGHVNGCLLDTCLTALDEFKASLDYFDWLLGKWQDCFDLPATITTSASICF